jgi:AraC-like DNA-binding protein
VDALWSVVAGDAVRSVVAADGCVDLIVLIGRDSRVEVLVHDAAVRAHEALVPAGTQFLGVRLRAGHGGPLLERAARLTTAARQHVEAGHDLLGLGSLVAQHVAEFGGPPAVMRDFLALAEEGRGTARLTGAVATAAERELQRAARRWLGMTSKAFLRIVRVRAARAAIRLGVPLAAVAAEFGYADQAHLTRDVRELLGVTPRQLKPVGILQDQELRRR